MRNKNHSLQNLLSANRQKKPKKNKSKELTYQLKIVAILLINQLKFQRFLNEK